MVDEVKKNWRTTACGVLMLVCVLAGAVGVPLLDSDPATNVDWAYVTENVQSALVVLGVAIPGFLGFLFSKDGDK
jgi:L-lactate permease